ncbi:MAG: AAA family ATPase [Actinobacteria bacterium]|nr:AAA family ATPase [Actinomycetota bacterium]
MYLKNIHLRGFKSFGVKSSLVFEPGISIIVGPNGSGKSNIVDAISWVLGEQSPKSLRSSSMGDIIFKSKNEELAIAEVSLVFDNTERTFPLDFAEVKFTRRTYIKGGSEYFINSSPCRLADIQDLIAESGIGRGLYTIINQGQINNVILNKPSDRKHIIDEIIGVSRHKIRRDKSRVKLDFCENDISRINDLLHEVKRTMDPLAVEAQRSKLFFDLSQEIKYEEISLFIANMNNLNKKWDEQLKVSKKNSDELIEIDKKIYLINSQKKEFENFFYQERESFNELENSLNAFNLLESRLKNLESIAGSQQISVETIINMINFSIKDLSGSFNNKKEAYNRERQIKEETEIKSLIKKVDELLITTDELFKKLSNWVSKSYINDLNNYKDVIIADIHSIKSTLDSLDLNSCVNEIKKNDDIGSKNEMENRINIEQQLKNLKEIKKYSELNIYNLKLLKDKSESLLKASVRIKNDITIKISSQKEISGSNQIKLSKYNEELNKLSSKKSFLENEIYRSDLKKEQIREKVKDMSIKIFDEYNMAIDYIMKNFNPSENIEQSQLKIRNLRSELQKYKNVNPNAHIEFEKVKERFEFLQGQKNDLAESKKSLEKLIVELNLKIMQYFNDKFNEINENFKYYFKMLFPLGNGELLITEDGQADDDLGIDISADIGNNKSVALQMLSGGEKALISIAFLFSIFAVNSSPFYIFDEIDAALDDANLNRFMTLARIFAQNRQVIIITHQKKTMEAADIIYGFTMQSNGITKIVSEKIKDTYVQAG